MTTLRRYIPRAPAPHEVGAGAFEPVPSSVADRHRHRAVHDQRRLQGAVKDHPRRTFGLDSITCHPHFLHPLPNWVWQGSLRSPPDRFPFSHFPEGWGPGCLHLRASSEHSFCRARCASRGGPRPPAVPPILTPRKPACYSPTASRMDPCAHASIASFWKRERCGAGDDSRCTGHQ